MELSISSYVLEEVESNITIKAKNVQFTGTVNHMETWITGKLKKS